MNVISANGQFLMGILNTAAFENQPNKSRKRVSEFLLATCRFQKENQLKTDDILFFYEKTSTLSQKVRFVKVLKAFLDTKGTHARRNELAQQLVIFFEKSLAPQQKLETRRFDEPIRKSLSKPKNSRGSVKDLMQNWVNS